MLGNLKEWETISRKANFWRSFVIYGESEIHPLLIKEGMIGLDWMSLIVVLQNRYFVCVWRSGGGGYIKAGSQAETFRGGIELTKSCHTGPD